MSIAFHANAVFQVKFCACSCSPSLALRPGATDASMTKAEKKKAVQFTRMCKFWRTNECKMGADCTFAHTTSELQPSPKPCFEFSKTGVCARGQECRFVHMAEGIKSNKKPKDMIDGGTLMASPLHVPFVDAAFKPMAFEAFNMSKPVLQHGNVVAPPTAFAPVSVSTPMPQQGSMLASPTALAPVKVSAKMAQQGSMVASLVQMETQPVSGLRPPPGLEDMGLMSVLAPNSLPWCLRKATSEDSQRSNFTEISLGSQRTSLPLPKAVDLEQMWAADDATVATQSLTSTMCSSATPSSFSESEGPEATSIWL